LKKKRKTQQQLLQQQLTVTTVDLVELVVICTISPPKTENRNWGWERDRDTREVVVGG